jgi:hypothetical protein
MGMVFYFNPNCLKILFIKIFYAISFLSVSLHTVFRITIKFHRLKQGFIAAKDSNKTPTRYLSGLIGTNPKEII